MFWTVSVWATGVLGQPFPVSADPEGMQAVGVVGGTHGIVLVLPFPVSEDSEGLQAGDVVACGAAGGGPCVGGGDVEGGTSWMMAS